jgi:hypothetical protein
MTCIFTHPFSARTTQTHESTIWGCKERITLIVRWHHSHDAGAGAALVTLPRDSVRKLNWT